MNKNKIIFALPSVAILFLSLSAPVKSMEEKEHDHLLPALRSQDHSSATSLKRKLPLSPEEFKKGSDVIECFLEKIEEYKVLLDKNFTEILQEEIETKIKNVPSSVEKTPKYFIYTNYSILHKNLEENKYFSDCLQTLCSQFLFPVELQKDVKDHIYTHFWKKNIIEFLGNTQEQCKIDSSADYDGYCSELSHNGYINKSRFFNILFETRKKILKNHKKQLNDYFENKLEFISKLRLPLLQFEKQEEKRIKATSDEKDNKINDLFFEIEEKNKNLEEVKKNLGERNQSLEDQNKSLEEDKKNLNEQNKNLQDQNKNLEEVKKKLREQNKSLEDQNKSLEEDKKNLNVRNKRIETQYSIEIQKLNEMQNSLASRLQEEKVRFTSLMFDAKKEYDSQNKKLKKQLIESRELLNAEKGKNQKKFEEVCEIKQESILNNFQNLTQRRLDDITKEEEPAAQLIPLSLAVGDERSVIISKKTIQWYEFTLRKFLINARKEDVRKEEIINGNLDFLFKKLEEILLNIEINKGS